MHNGKATVGNMISLIIVNNIYIDNATKGNLQNAKHIKGNAIQLFNNDNSYGANNSMTIAKVQLLTQDPGKEKCRVQVSITKIRRSQDCSNITQF